MNAFINIGIGEHILHELEFKQWNQVTFAEAMEISEKHASKLINNEVQLSVDLAVKLSKLFGISAESWLRIDNEYRLRKLEENKFNCMTVRGELYSRFPIRDMKKLGWIRPRSNKTEDILKSIQNFTNDGNLEAFFNKMSFDMAARSSKCFEDKFNQGFAKVWLHKAMQISNELVLPDYNASLLDDLLSNVNYYTKSSRQVRSFIDKLTESGVGFISLPHLSNTYLDGAAFYCGNNPIIAYTARYDRLDNFWFTIMHELGHIVKNHLNKDRALLDSEDSRENSKQEREADEFAESNLGLDKIFSLVKNYNKIPSKLLSNIFGFFDYLHPSIIIGTLQHRGKISYRSHNQHKEKVKYLLD